MSRPPTALTSRLSARATRTLSATFVAVLGALALLLPLLISAEPTAGAVRRVDIPSPLLYNRSFADPTVVESRVGLVGAATALNLNIGRSPADAGPWNVINSPALTRRPSWATSAEIWAPDIQRAPGGWLLYFAAGISGADPNSRCIGVAVSAKAFGPYTPVGNAPLVCPVVPGVPPAADRPPVRVLGRVSATRGVIDPSSFVANNGKRYLVYRTQGQPSSIRLVPLSQRGRRVQAGKTSIFLTTHEGIEENPAIVRHDEKWVMFTSVGWFGHCAYRTYWRRSPDFRDWSRATPKLILSTANGLCGPGGADVLTRRDGTDQLYFHAWTCFRGPYPCPPDWNKDRPRKQHGIRALYGATLGWTPAGRPFVAGWVGSILPPPTPTATPTPTDSPTVSPSPTDSPSSPTDSPTVTDSTSTATP